MKTIRNNLTKLTFVFLLLVSSISAKIVDLKEYQTSVKDQRDRNTCAYFAITALIESAIKVQFNRDFDISEQFQISWGKEHFGEYKDKEFGSTYDIALNFRNQYFFIKEEDAPYQDSLFAPGKLCEKYDPFDTSAPAVCFSHGVIDPFKGDIKRVRIDGLDVEWISGMWSIGKTRSQLLMDHMDRKKSVVVTVMVYPPKWDFAQVEFTDEDSENCKNGTYECAGHAILLTGYDSDRKVFFFKNSWSESWGNEGYGEIGFDYIDKYSDTPMTASFKRMFADLKE